MLGKSRGGGMSRSVIPGEKIKKAEKVFFFLSSLKEDRRAKKPCCGVVVLVNKE